MNEDVPKERVTVRDQASLIEITEKLDDIDSGKEQAAKRSKQDQSEELEIHVKGA